MGLRLETEHVVRRAQALPADTDPTNWWVTGMRRTSSTDLCA
jgi:hypothetical protein